MSDGKKAKEEGDYLMGLATMMSMVCLVFIYCTSSILVSVFDLTNQQVINEATLIVKVFALRIALRFFIVIVFSSLRAGGDSKVLTLLDSGLMWSVGIPLAFISVHIFSNSKYCNCIFDLSIGTSRTCLFWNKTLSDWEMDC